MLEGMLRHIDQATWLGPSTVVLVVLLGIDVTLTLVHSLQELRGRLWRYFGAIVGAWLPDPLGVLLFFVLLTLSLWSLGWMGIAGHVPLVGQSESLAMAAIGVLIGARLSDRRYSHVLLDRQGYRPNPGLQSTPYYLADAVFLMVAFFPGLRDHYLAAVAGFVAGWGAFVIVLPAMRLLRVLPFLRRERWKAGEPSPAWARLTEDGYY